MTFDQSENNGAAAAWLERRFREVITETERRFGVYAAYPGVLTKDHGDYWGIVASIHIWPEAMRIIETEPESEAIG